MSSTGKKYGLELLRFVKLIQIVARVWTQVQHQIEVGVVVMGIVNIQHVRGLKVQTDLLVCVICRIRMPYSVVKGDTLWDVPCKVE